MKKIITAVILTAVMSLMVTIFSFASSKSFIRTTSDNYDIVPLVGTAIDYSDDSNWMYKQTNAEHEVDLLYLYPTVCEYASEGYYLHNVDEEMKRAANYAFAETGSAFEPYVNIFAPYYTQNAMTSDINNISYEGKKEADWEIRPDDIEKLSSSKSAGFIYTKCRTDVYAALDYYFENCNNGRPFIMAGHSQGSVAISFVLEEYMKVHPEYLKRMVAAYVIGFAVNQDYMDANPHLKFAEGETDTGCIVSYNVEGPDATMPSGFASNKALSINPLNWKTDSTPASAEQNKGKLVQDHILHNWEIVTENVSGAVIDPERKTIICTTNTDYETNAVMGDKSLHTYDYAEYYENLRENGSKRASAFLGHEVR